MFDNLKSTLSQMSKRQKIILSIYTILGCLALPLSIFFLLSRRYVFEDKEILKPENRVQFIVEFCSSMIAFTVFGGLIWLLVHFIR